MNRFVLRWAINMAALYLTVGTRWIPGIHAENTTGLAILVMALIFTWVHTFIRPILKVLSCPLILLTMGLFTLIINTFLFLLTGWIGNAFTPSFGYSVDNVWAAFLGAMVVSVVNLVLSFVFRDELKLRRERNRH